jgi:hypothetical protein
MEGFEQDSGTNTESVSKFNDVEQRGARVPPPSPALEVV